MTSKDITEDCFVMLLCTALSLVGSSCLFGWAKKLRGLCTLRIMPKNFSKLDAFRWDAMGLEKPYLAVFLVQAIYAGMIFFTKVVLSDGTKSYIFIFYRQSIGAACILPFAIIVERISSVKLSFVTFCKIFMISLLGITLALNLYSIAVVYTSAALGATMLNAPPVSTFLFAFLLGMEKLAIKTKPGVVKIGGLLLCVAGVATLTLYKGPQLRPPVHVSVGYHEQHHHQDRVSSEKYWILGCLLFLVSIIAWGLWLVLQGTMSTGVLYYMQAWVLEKKGPVFYSMSTPLNFIITIIGSMFLLGEDVPLGSVLGGLLLVLSLYAVLWAKTKEESANAININKRIASV